VVARAAGLACLAALAFVSEATADDALPGGRAVVVTTSVSPDVHLFAEPVTARVDVLLDPGQLDPDRIRVDLRFAPYELLGPVEKTRRTRGDIVELRYVARLRCLDAQCLAPRFQTALGEQEGGRAERSSFRFAPAGVLHEREGAGLELLLQRPFPAAEAVSRINTARLDDAAQAGGFEEALLASTYTASLEPPPPTYRLAPERLAALALGIAVLLALFPAVLAGRFLLARWRASRRPRRLSPLERALVLVEWTGRQEDGAEDRRKALDALADALERSGAEPLAETARTLAWAEEPPRPERAGELAARARSAEGNGRAR
jgi:hypothetical protein